MSHSATATPAETGARAHDDSAASAPTTALTIYGCRPDEAALFRELAPQTGITPRFIDAAPSEASAELARGTRHVSVGHQSRVTASTLRAFARAGVTSLSTRSVGCDHIDLEEAARLGIAVGTVAYSPDSVADHTLMLMLMAVRHAAQTVRRVDAGDFRLGERRGRELRDLTVGVVGTGRIGSAVIARLHGFGARVLSVDTRMPVSRGSASADDVTLDELVERSDIVTLHAPLTNETHHLLDARRLARMRPDAVVVNTARGGLVDTAALLEALESGRLGGAALDVVEGEEGVFYTDRRRHPIDGSLARLRALPNVLITPHAAFDTDHALHDIVENTLRACLEFENGRRDG